MVLTKNILIGLNIHTFIIKCTLKTHETFFWVITYLFIFFKLKFYIIFLMISE